uniref:CSC1/OSCA1-like N-terminal transmembrane domain-containing protein n=1 Tax=Helianthus annuus TaxID=4232 RepID=A0A251TI68_HELAN
MISCTVIYTPNLYAALLLVLSSLISSTKSRLQNDSLRSSYVLFTIAGFVGIFILIPVNCSGNQLQDVNFINITNNTLDVFSISNVNNGSTSLWIHLGAVYFVTIIYSFSASFFIAYVVTLGWMSTSSELFRVVPFIGTLICKPFSRNSDNVTVLSFPYHKDVPKILFLDF